MPRRAVTVTQADVARTIRAARQAGADTVEVRTDGTIVIHVAAPPLVPESDDPFEAWERDYESEKTARRRQRV
jgi:hypothetical protein